MKSTKKTKERGVGVGDMISSLPDDLLHHIMSFLPLRDAVRTFMLSLRWLHLWESMTCLNINARGFTSERRFIDFVNKLMLCHGIAPLNKFRICANGSGIFLSDLSIAANRWIRHALRSNVQELGIVDKDPEYASDWEEFYEEDGWPTLFCPYRYSFTSSHLKKLHLRYIKVNNCFVKQLFSGCQALEDLKMINCVISATEFSSTTLKNLSITYVNFRFPEQLYEAFHDIVIDMPNLVLLHIGKLICTMPSLINVQSLVTASIFLDDSPVTFANACQILGALSNVKNLELMFDSLEGRIFPVGSEMLCHQVVFTNLTTLCLDDWCLHGGCKALLYLLKYSPNLEKLTLRLNYNYDKAEWLTDAAAKINLPCNKIETSFDCKKLKKIEINIPHGDRRVGIILAILCASTTSLPEINIKHQHDPRRRTSVSSDTDSD